MARLLTGIQSSGEQHLGNLLGALAPAIELSQQPGNDAFYFIADLHSLTTLRDGEQRRHNTRAAAAAWLSAGFDYQKNTFYRQSDLAGLVNELTWYLGCFAPYPMLANAHSFKDKSDRLSDVNAGLFYYPVLMAADILLYDANFVPVGKDQKQHLEITRDMAQALNNSCGEELLVMPEPLIREEVMTIPGTDGRKMSKSYGNTINIFGPAKTLKKQVMGIITDSTPLESPKNPDTCNVVTLYKLVATKNQIAEMEANYRKGGYGYGHAKKELLGVLTEKYGEMRENYARWMERPDDLEDILKMGAEKARPIAQAVLARVRGKLGFN
ncbi:MAG: tryptophan--tRNA ligase [Cryomorphaceae bacterium]|nr:tryptophan--tRNA ligase [Cryomorphaceae bacterium]